VETICVNSNAFPHQAAGYIPPLDRLRAELAADRLKPIYLPEVKRADYYFSEPKEVTVRADPEAGRRPFVLYKGVRYRSTQLQSAFHLVGKKLFVRPGLRNIQYVMLFKPDGSEFGRARANGVWGSFPHDVRIRQLWGRLKNDAALTHAKDAPLEALFSWLREKAPTNKAYALEMAYVLEYLASQSAGSSRKANQEQRDLLALAELVSEMEVVAASPTPSPGSALSRSAAKSAVSPPPSSPPLQYQRRRTLSRRL
jgi:hypothetical protein